MIKSTTLDTSATTVFQSSGDSIISTMYFCNTSTAVLTFNLYLVPAGQLASIENIVYYAVEVGPTDTYVVNMEKIMLSNGDTIQANTAISGVMVTTVSSMGY